MINTRIRSIWTILLGFTLTSMNVIALDHDITEYGAIGDGVTLNTIAIQAAIDACAESGGGRVVFGPGRFLSGTIELRDHVELHLSGGATLLGSTQIEDYPERVTDFEFYGHEWVRQSLIFGDHLEDIAITGAGTIDGQGAAFKVETKKKPDRYKNRPFLIRLTECRRITVKDVTMQNSAMWMQHYLACEDMLISGIRVYNHCNKNNDMIDIDGCKNVVITGCLGDTDDDALTLKSTSPRACENITISNCVLSSHCNAIKMGTESTGGFRNITITGCVVKPSSTRQVIYGLPDGISGISLEVVDGGTMEAIVISDIVIDGPEVPLFIRLGNRARPYREKVETPPVGSISDVIIQNVVARNGGETGCSITGIPGHPVKNISISNLILQLKGGIEAGEYRTEVPELERLYPESTMFGVLPASALYLRHLENIDISGLKVNIKEVDARETIISEDVKGLTYKGK